jgi:hypothetical protein
MASQIMISHNHILSIIKDSTSQQPMSKFVLLANSGFSEPELNAVLTEMYALAKIGKCTLTKYGVTDEVYWPTGVTKITPDYGRNFTESPLRRESVVKEKNMELTQVVANAVQAEKVEPAKTFKETADTRPTTLKILEFIAAHPDCNFTEIKEGTGINFPLAYVKSALHRNKVIATKHANHKCTYKLADGLTPDDIYIKKGQKHAERSRLNAAVVADEVTPAAVKEEFDIPAFLRKSADKTDEFAVADSVDEKLGAVEAYIPPADKTPFADTACLMEVCIETLLDLMPEGCHITLRHPQHENIQVEIDGTLLANPIVANLDKLGITFDAIKTLQQAAYL